MGVGSMKLKEIRPITIITGIVGFCLGAIFPTYTLLIKDDGALGSIPDWLGTFGTIGALFLSIYVAKTSFDDAKKEKQERMKTEVNYLKGLQESIQDVRDMVGKIKKNDESAKFYAKQELYWDMPIFDELAGILTKNGDIRAAGQTKTWISEFKRRYNDSSIDLNPEVVGDLTTAFLKFNVIVKNAENRLESML